MQPPPTIAWRLLYRSRPKSFHVALDLKRSAHVTRRAADIAPSPLAVTMDDVRHQRERMQQHHVGQEVDLIRRQRCYRRIRFDHPRNARDIERTFINVTAEFIEQTTDIDDTLGLVGEIEVDQPPYDARPP